MASIHPTVASPSSTCASSWSCMALTNWHLMSCTVPLTTASIQPTFHDLYATYHGINPSHSGQPFIHLCLKLVLYGFAHTAGTQVLKTRHTLQSPLYEGFGVSYTQPGQGIILWGKERSKCIIPSQVGASYYDKRKKQILIPWYTVVVPSKVRASYSGETTREIYVHNSNTHP